MLGAWKRNKFYSKCKSTISQFKTRIEMVRKKRNAMQKYLKNDIADLLKTGFDANAYDRTEGLLVELNLLSCYDFLEQYSDHILSHLETTSKQRECPEECREPVASLMFAAARLADLPELRQLRTIFFERYGNSLECHVNKQFVEKLKPVPHTKVMKFQLMKDIAAEYRVEWNSKILQQKLYESEQHLPSGKEQMDESGTNKESVAAISNHENVKHHHTEVECNGDDDAVDKAKPEPKSVRRKYLEPLSGNEETGIGNHSIKISNGELLRQSKPNSPSSRRASFPIELERTTPEELMKGHTRAKSFQPDIFGPNGHVHPRLPNYDEVLARLEDLSTNPK